MAPSTRPSSPGKNVPRVRGSEKKVAPISGAEIKVDSHTKKDDVNAAAKLEKNEAPITINGKKYSITGTEWKTLAPMDGKGVIKHGNKTWRWCAPCNEWMFHDVTKHDFWAVRNLTK
jgi:hypothetical protein